MPKRYNMKIVEMGSDDVVYEVELQITRIEGGVFLANLMNEMVCDIENAIEEVIDK